LPNPEAIQWPASYSPSSANGLIACPLSWVLQRAGRISTGNSASLPDGPLLFGNLAHHVLEAVVHARDERDLTPTDAAGLADLILDRDGARLAAALFLPGQEPQLDDVRTAIRDSASELVRQLDAACARLEATERHLEGACQDMTLHGYADILLAEPRSVIDIKWGSAARYRDELLDGGASQLAVYASLFADGGPPAVVAYFIVTRQHFYTNDTAAWPEGDLAEGFTMAQTLAGFRAAVDHRIAEVNAGAVSAPAALVEDLDELRKQRVGLIDGALTLVPKCQYCDYAAMCRGGDR